MAFDSGGSGDRAGSAALSPLKHHEAIAQVCLALSRSHPDKAAGILQLHYPFAPTPTTKRSYGPLESTRVFARDGFIDRYTGERLIYPPVLRLLSTALPSEFPFHPNWRADRTHPAYWELSATVDHLVPVTRGGADNMRNWVTTSMARNSAKGNWSLEELGWRLHPPGALSDWDGMLRWYVEHLNKISHGHSTSGLRAWHRAARKVLSTVDSGGIE